MESLSLSFVLFVSRSTHVDLPRVFTHNVFTLFLQEAIDKAKEDQKKIMESHDFDWVECYDPGTAGVGPGKEEGRDAGGGVGWGGQAERVCFTMAYTLVQSETLDMPSFFGSCQQDRTRSTTTVTAPKKRSGKSRQTTRWLPTTS
jgi:hypothetical protein